MAKGDGPTQSSPAAPPPSLKKSDSGSQNSKNQKSILGFFQKKSTDRSLPPLIKGAAASPSAIVGATKRLVKRPAARRHSGQTLTPAPSSDAAECPNQDDAMQCTVHEKQGVKCLPSPTTPIPGAVDGNGIHGGVTDSLGFNSPSRKVTIQSCCCVYIR